MNNGMMPMNGAGRAPPPPDYGMPRGGARRPSDPAAPGPGFRDASPRPTGNYVAYTPDEVRRSSLPRAESPPPLENIGMVGQAIEMVC